MNIKSMNVEKPKVALAENNFIKYTTHVYYSCVTLSVLLSLVKYFQCLVLFCYHFLMVNKDFQKNDFCSHSIFVSQIIFVLFVLFF